MHPIPYLFFDGTCGQAMAFYADVLGAEIEAQMPASDMPDEFPVPDDRKDWVMHGSLKISDGYLMMSDNLFEESAGMSGASVMLSYPTLAEAASVFDALAEGGQITMAFEPTFWSAGFGTLTDKFGVQWMVGCDEPPG